ncbi:MAG: serine protease, partial [Synechococcus sp. SB0673_bin_10]|nr:serine protease [Synechococcus sp. SB0673_bin_10]
MVSGGLAIMKQLFRGQLSSEQLVSRLLTTAKDDGIYADSAIYGHGLMDLGAATSPWG